MSVKAVFQNGSDTESSWMTQQPIATEGVTALAEKCRDTYTLLLKPGEDGWLVATVPELKGVVTQGKTVDEAAKNAVEATELMLEELGKNTEFTLVLKRIY